MLRSGEKRMKTKTLSELQIKHGKLKREYNELKEVYSITNGKMAAIRSELANVGLQIRGKKEEAVEPIVSDHAIKRYFERVKGFDIEQVKRDILTGHDFEAIIDRNVVVTVITRPGDEE